MKHITIGLVLLLSSAIMYSAALIAASVYSLVLTRDGGEGWSTEYGVYGTALREIGTLPIALAILFGLIGAGIVIDSVRKTKI
ncbi:phosphatase [Bacillus salacetis]|uniref:Phosphatase n=1 Tax=Bacillus salacetis TaxID=2315464 RepID=A0A3A1QV68_9BACI|nr:phosphatase [Bacillus salacetis]RIW31871.1 phosphatase [Bacillus salacetis]